MYIFQPKKCETFCLKVDATSIVNATRLLICIGDKAQESKGTLANISVQSGEKAVVKSLHSWKAYIVSVSNEGIGVAITSPVDAIVSAYRITVKVFVKDENHEERRYMTIIDSEIYLLFNPWCKGM